MEGSPSLIAWTKGAICKVAVCTSLAVVATLLPPAVAHAAPSDSKAVERIVADADRAAPSSTKKVAVPAPKLKVSRHGKTGTVETGSGQKATLRPSGSESVVRTKPDGVQALTVIRKGSTAKFDLSLSKGLALVKSGKKLEVRDSATRSVVVGTIKTPWAVDANGKRLSTWYDLKGTTLIQHVDSTHAAYPIVADPYISFGWYIYLNLEPWAQRTLVGMGYWGAIAWIGAAVCTPTIVGGPAVAACVAIVGGLGWGIWEVITHYWSPTRTIVLKFAWCCPPGRYSGWYYR